MFTMSHPYYGMRSLRTMTCMQIYLTLVFARVVGGRYGFITWPPAGMEVALTDRAADIPDDCVAKASFKDQIQENGWAFLEVSTGAAHRDERQARAAGVLEGYLCRDLIWMHWVNLLKGYCAGKADMCKLIETFLNKNEHYVLSTAKARQHDPYWYQVLLYYYQLEGVTRGYNKATVDPSQHLSFRDIFWLNMIGDLDELSYALWLRSGRAGRHAPPAPEPFADHCSGLVKLLPDLSDLYTAQCTWNSYQSMLRLQKLYVLNFRSTNSSTGRIPGYKMSFSSYPGIVQSLDDFYIISSGLVAAETTIGNSRRALYRRIRPQRQILEFVRVMVANRLARDGREWVQLFSNHNSGTYNNQWYIVDYNKFEPATSATVGRVRPGLLWVLEQLPGTTESADLTSVLIATTYFPSYNMAYFPRIFELSGGRERVRVYGDWFGQDTHPRAKMFELLQADIRSLRDMFRVMRYNDYRHDPLARCAACRPPYSACNAIAARNDLNPANGTYPFRALGHRSHGATDAKLTSWRLRRRYQFLAVSGPPHNASRGVPPFSWSAFDLGANISHLGHPDTWVFPPLRHPWEWADG